MSWDNELLERAHKIIELYPQKRSALGPLLYWPKKKMDLFLMIPLLK